MKKIITLMVTALVALAINATVKVSGPEKDILSISADNQGELSWLDFNSLTDEQKSCTSVKLIGQFSANDLEKLVTTLPIDNIDASDVTKINGDGGAFFFGQNSAFSGLKTFTFPKYLTVVNVGWFSGGNIENLIIPDGIGNGEGATIPAGYGGHSKLKTVYIGKGVTEIGNGAFQGDLAIERIEFAPGIKTIGSSAFQYCPAKNIILPEGLETIGSNAFQRAQVYSLHLPKSLKIIGGNAFQECNNLSAIVIPENVEYIGGQAFKGADIKDVYVLGKNTKAGQNAFDPKDTYSGMNYTPNGDVDRTDWTNEQGVHPAILHYPVEAKDKYLNGKILHPENWPEYYISGVEWPIKGNNFSSGENENTEYIGWQEFMLTDVLDPEEQFIVPNILDDNWYTMCFPFDLTLSQLYTTFGDFTEVCEFVKAETTETEGGKTIEFQFSNWIGKNKNANEIVTHANRPYMIHPNFGLEEGKQLNQRVVIAGINILPEEQQTTWTSANYKEGEDGEYIFVGNYKQQAIPQYAYFLGMKNGEVKIFKQLAAANQSRETGRWKEYTSIIMTGALFDENTGFWTCSDDGVSKTSMGYNAKFIDYNEEESVTGISEIQNSEKTQMAQDNIVRSINGQVVRRGTPSLEGLPKGLYIVNGKKYMVR